MSTFIPYGQMVQEYYVNRVRALAAERRRRRAAIRTPAAAARLVRDVRARIARCFGPFPPRTPLAPVVTGVVLRERYRIETVMFSSRPDFPVTANLYVPLKRNGACPGVFFSCGHNPLGKAAVNYQTLCRSLASNGFVVLIYDPISQGERRQYVNDRHPLAPKALCDEHNMLGNRMSLTGEFFGAWRAWDGIRALDYLLTRPEVDPARIGVTGNSGGGTLTSFLNALDDRVAMAAPSCYVTTMLRNIENELPQDSEQIPPGFLAAGLDMADFFIARAPRPTLLLGQRNDFFDPRGLRETYEEVRRVYALLGAEDHVACFIGPDEHGLHRENRAAIGRFMARCAGIRWMRNEAPIPVEDEATLFCTPTGQVEAAIPACRKVPELTRSDADTLRRQRRRFTGSALRTRAAAMLALPPAAGVPAYRVLRSISDLPVKKAKYVSRFAVETEPGIQAILHYISNKPEAYRNYLDGGAAAVLHVPHLSSWTDIQDGEILGADGGTDVFALDPRGVGESLPIRCSMTDFFASYDSDFLYACNGSLLGQPYLGGKVFDVLQTLALLHERGYKTIHLVGRGLGAITGAFAALLSEHVTRVTLKNALLSYDELARQSACKWPLSHMLPGVLRHFDLPDVYAALAARKLEIIDPWDEQMRLWKPVAGRRHAARLGIRKVRKGV